MRGRGKTKAQLVEELDALRLQQRALLDSTSDAIITTDLDFVIQGWNKAAEAMYGWSAEEAIGRHTYEIIPPEQTDQRREDARAQLRDTGAWTGEVVQTRNDGTRIVVHSTVNTVMDDAGRATTAIAINRDITARKCAELKLAESEMLFRQLAERTVVGIYVIQDGMMTYVNPSLATIFGYEREEIVGTLTPRDLIHPDDIDVVMKKIDDRQGGATQNRSAVYRALRKDGSLISIEVHGQRIEFDGKPAVFGTLIDVTERVRSDERLRQSESRYRTVVANVREGILVVSAGQKRYYNDRVAELLGYTAAEYGEMEFMATVHPGDRAEVLRRWSLTTQAGRTTSDFECRVVTKEGEARWIRVGTSPLTWQGEAATIAFIEDITERRKLREEILEIASRERRLVGRELHDGIGQDLAGAGLLAAALAQKLVALDSPAVSEARALEVLLGATVVKSRQLAHGLHPVALDTVGLDGALEELAESTSRVFAVPCTTAVHPDVAVSDPKVGEYVFRIAHEAVMNAVLHGEPTAVSIELRPARPGAALLIVTDDGTGLPSTMSPGTGIRIMEFRARTIGGALEVRPGSVGGTEVRCEFPTTAAAAP